MVSPMPKYRFKSVLDITIEDLNKMGARAVALDIDNTICNDGRDNVIDGLESWLKDVQESGIKVMIISNAIGKRPRKVAESLGLAHLSFARKPKVEKLLQGAELMGVKINRVISVTFIIGSLLAAVGSILYFANYPSVVPTSGAMPGLKSFVAAVFGGIGSIPGAVIGAFIIGICENLIRSLSIGGVSLTPFSDAFTFALLIVILCVRPSGLFGEKTIDKV